MIRNRILVAAFLLCAVTLGGCAKKGPQLNGYQQGAVPGITRQRIEAILGKPQQEGPFSVPGSPVHAVVSTYPFGQVLMQNDRVVAVSVNSAPDFRGPFGITIGMTEDQVRAAVASHPKHRAGHRESYDAIEGQNDTRTRDIYDETDHVMIELAAANPNDPLAPFYVSQITLANDDGLRLLEAFTKARVNGLYPDVHVDNFVTEPWPSSR